MPAMEIINILKNVITSWQVIVVTIAILLYISIVNNVSKSYRTPRVKKAPKVKKQKAAAAETPIEEANDDLPSGSSNDELGLEES